MLLPNRRSLLIPLALKVHSLLRCLLPSCDQSSQNPARAAQSKLQTVRPLPLMGASNQSRGCVGGSWYLFFSVCFFCFFLGEKGEKRKKKNNPKKQSKKGVPQKKKEYHEPPRAPPRLIVCPPIKGNRRTV